MFSKKVNLVFRDKDGDSKWFRFLNITMWIQKFCKPSVRGNFGCIKPLLQSRIIGMDVGKYEGEWKNGKEHGQGTYYSSSGGKLVGRFKGGIPWNTTDFDEDQNFIGLHVRGVEREIIPLKPK